MIVEHGCAMPIDDGCAVADTKEVGGWRVGILLVGLFLGNAGAGVFDDQRAFANAGSGVAAGGVDGRRANDQRHTIAEYREWDRRAAAAEGAHGLCDGPVSTPFGIPASKLGEMTRFIVAA